MPLGEPEEDCVSALILLSHGGLTGTVTDAERLLGTEIACFSVLDPSID
jgi:hypothetical protein